MGWDGRGYIALHAFGVPFAGLMTTTELLILEVVEYGREIIQMFAYTLSFD